jgi:pSer/pThr/pTyr-binding forkhead associated (FHA) protein
VADPLFSTLILVVRLGNRVLLRTVVGSEPLLFGAGADVDIHLPGKGLEKHHAELRRVGDELRVSPLGRGRLLCAGVAFGSEISLRIGEEINAGLYTLQVERDDAFAAGGTEDSGLRPRDLESVEIGHLELCVGGSRIGRYALHEGAVIGRNVDAWISLDDAALAPRHAEFSRVEDGRVQIRDLGSATGTRVNGSPIGTAVLKSGDEITVGPFTFRLVAGVGMRQDFVARRGTAWGLLALSLLLLVFAAGRRLHGGARGFVAEWQPSSAAAERTAGGLTTPVRSGRGTQPLDARIDSLLALHCAEPEERGPLRELHQMLGQALQMSVDRAAPRAEISDAPEDPIEPQRPLAVTPTATKPSVAWTPPRPPDVMLAGPSPLRLAPGAQVRLDLEFAAGEERTLAFDWEARRGRLRPHRRWCSYVAPALTGADRVSVRVQAADGASVRLTKEIEITPEARNRAPESGAEEAFWRGYRFFNDARIRDLGQARKELEAALSAASELPPQLRQRALSMLTEIDSLSLP